jgi:hypothetical protein
MMGHYIQSQQQNYELSPLIDVLSVSFEVGEKFELERGIFVGDKVEGEVREVFGVTEVLVDGALGLLHVLGVDTLTKHILLQEHTP